MPDLWQDALPDSLLLHIFSFMDSHDLGVAAQVCQKWYRVALDDALWHSLARWKWKIKGPRKPGTASWREEVKRMTWHVPSVCMATICQHKHQVLDVSFSNRGDLFCTSSKDAHVILWQIGNPCSLLVDRNMNQGCVQWDLCQLSAFNSSDTLLLVCGTEQNLQLSEDFDNALIVTVGVCTIFTVPEMKYVCSVRLEPPTLFSAWVTENMIIGGLPCQDTEDTTLLIVYKITEDMVQSSVRDICCLKYIHSIPFLKISGIRWHLMNLLVAHAGLPNNQKVIASQSSCDAESSVLKCFTNFKDVDANIKDLERFGSESCQMMDSESVPLVMDSYSARDHSQGQVNPILSESPDDGQTDLCNPMNLENGTDQHRHYLITGVGIHKQMNSDQFEDLMGAWSSDVSLRHFVIFVSGQHDEIHVHDVTDLLMQQFDVCKRPANRHVDAPDHVLHYKNSYITGIALSRDHRLLYVNLREWDPDNPLNQPVDGEELAAFEVKYNQYLKLGCVDLATMSKIEGVMYKGHIGYSGFPAWYICLDVSNNFVASCSEDNHVYIYDRHYQHLLQRLAHGEHPPCDSESEPETTVTNGVAFSPVDEETCISVCDGKLIKVWQSKNRQQLEICQQHF
ncbi:F-box/WD repeat-containing protein 5-like isoform X2 [Dreissena polymorpha]|uniref:F-box domain-containing protein n=1 Tax=Dreissena polymorpha TaxID=45954 RepID=A0A9D4K6I2_DREPO|nr:F-box/WD repeat-containing protein 5-like isoform X2 [Dreissena polymorpha]KAH3834005.1 hypothetical protein DPMN_107323 [Dreissena polymorpha]